MHANTEDRIGGILGFASADDSASPGDLLAVISSASQRAADTLPAPKTTRKAVISVPATSTVESAWRPGMTNFDESGLVRF